jgi:hypothetical protein
LNFGSEESCFQSGSAENFSQSASSEGIYGCIVATGGSRKN